MIFYILLGIYTIWTVYKLKTEIHHPSIKKILINPYFFSYSLILTIFAAFRVVVHGIGGSDAIAYIFLFEHCNDPAYANHSWILHNDFLFRYLTKFLRLFIDDYHFYFFILYGFNVTVYLLFLVVFCRKHLNYIPCLLLIFLYWRSFNTLRSNTAVAVFLVSIILLYKKKYIYSIAAAFSTVFIHKMLGVSLLFFPFYFIFSKYKLNRTRFLIALISVIVLGVTIQSVFLNFAQEMEFETQYSSYARGSMSSSFWNNTWKIAFEQMLLGMFMWINYKKIKKKIHELDELNSKTLNIIWIVCIFDMLMIPIFFYLGAWRGVSIMYMPRIVLWCEFITLFMHGQPKEIHMLLNYLFLTVFAGWMVFRFYNMWEDSNLMPYLFEPLTNM